MSRVGDFVEKRRKQLNMTQAELGAVLGFNSTKQFVSNIARGESEWPDFYLPKLCRILKISRYELVEYYIEDRKRDFNKLFRTKS